MILTRGDTPLTRSDVDRLRQEMSRCSIDVARMLHAGGVRIVGRNSFGAVRKLPSGRYQASYICHDGRRHPALSTFSHREDAYAWLSAERRHLEEGSA